MYIHISNPPFQARSFVGSYFAIRDQHILPYLRRSKSVFLFLRSFPNNSYIFFSWFLSLVSGLVRIISGLRLADVKEPADLPT